MGYNNWGSSYDYWESGAWKGPKPHDLGYYTQGLPKWGGWGATIGGIGLASWAGAKLGGTLGMFAGPVGALVGAGIGAIGGLAAGAAWNLGAAGWDYMFGGAKDIDFKKLEFTPPVVNTKMAATMRQSAMQMMMGSSQNYRQILGREASRLHR